MKYINSPSYRKASRVSPWPMRIGLLVFALLIWAGIAISAWLQT